MPGNRLNRTEAKELTRRRLLDSAFEMCAERGVHGASVDAIAENAGYSKGAVYSHFGGREQLMLALFEERIKTFADQLLSVLQGEDVDVPMVAGMFVANALEQARSHFVILCEFWSDAARDKSLRPQFARSRREYRALLTEVVEAEATRFGVTLPMLATDLAAGLLALSLGLMLEGLVDDELVPGTIYRGMLDLVYRGALAAQEPT